MHHKFKIVNPEPFVKAVEDMNCGKTRFAELSAEHFEVASFTIKAPSGYKAPKEFPKCCKFHLSIFNDIEKWFKDFPSCCESHKKLLEVEWFDKENYKGIAKKVLDQLMYTEFVTIQRINDSDWYENITDYIYYSISSFGQLPSGYGSPVGLTGYITNVKILIQNLTKEKYAVPFEKTTKLVEFIESYCAPSSKTKIDINILETTYKNWLKAFPFGISYFKNLKQEYDGQFPILKGEPTYNRYSGLASIKLTTQSELVETLTNITKQLLRKIDSTRLVEEGLIDDASKHLFELTNVLQRIKQDSLLDDFTKGEIEYIRVLRKWLTNEREYFKEVERIMEKKLSSRTLTVKYGAKLQFPPIANEDTFEDFVCDLYNAIFPHAHFQRHGKKGNKQKGVDVLSIIRKEAIQCKKKDVSRNGLMAELKKDFESDIVKATNLNIDIKLLIFVSTFDDNAELSEHLQYLKKQINPKFEVLYLGWQSLSTMTQSHRSMIEKYFMI